jgi:DNA-binding transcriptional LysR family regulator
VDLRQLRTFVTVAEQGTVSRAALQLHVAQPALSRQISDLEDELGLKLFDRIRRRLVLTGEGEQLLEDCRAVLGAAHSLGERAQRLRRGETGILRVGATPQTIEGVFSTFLARYAKRHPDVQVRLTEAVGVGQLSMLERGEIQLCVSLAGLTQSVKGYGEVIESFELSPIEFLAASPKWLEVGTSGEVDIGQLEAYPLLLMDTSFYVRTTFDAACRVAGIKPNVFVESRTPHALLALAEAGHGVAVVPSVLPTRRYRLRVARVTHRRRPLTESLVVLWDKRRALSPYARDFCDALAEHARAVIPRSRAR